MINMQKILLLLLILCVLFCNGCPEEKCFGQHEFYACGNDCDNECSTLGRQNRTNCRSNVNTCMCYCEDGYARDENNVCIPVDQCKIDQCLLSNEVLRCRYICPPELTCRTRGLLFSCFRYETEVCQDKCECRTGYYRNAIGDCISNAQCDQCSGDNEFFSCGTECDNECGKIGIQNRTNCPIVNIVCNERCYCEDGFSRDVNNNCVPNSKCPDVRCPEENENLACVINNSEPTCKNRSPISDNKCGKCKPQCLCDKGLYRNEIGKCVSAEDCDKCPAENEFFACGNECDNECSRLDVQNRTNCRTRNEPCIEKCYCADGYARDENNVCVPVDQCPKATCNQNEIYRCVRNCPPEGTCSTRNATYSCPAQREGDPCQSKCICSSGYYRNYIGECISGKDCDKCQREHEFYSPCGGACDNRCSSIDTFNRTNCGVQTFACVASCYCEDGFARDDDNNCIPITNCTTGCGLHEYRMNCLQTCPPDECFSIVARFKCDPDPPCSSGCHCQDGFLRRDENKPCMPIKECPEVANSPDFN